MSQNVIQPSFSAGELSPTLFGRVDLAKYHVGAAVMENFFVDYRGGASSRPGLAFVTRCLADDTAVVLISFQFSSDQSYILAFGNLTMMVLKDSGVVLEPGKAITGVQLTKVMRVELEVGHGFVVNDRVFISGVVGTTELNELTALVAGVTDDSITLKDLDGNEINGKGFTEWVSGGTASKIFVLATPYVAADLNTLKFAQSADVMTLTHPNYAPRNLSRLDEAEWTLEEINFAPGPPPPTNVVGDPSEAGFAEYAYVVTSVDEDGIESYASERCDVHQTIDIATQPGSIQLTWDRAEGAVYYNVYKANHARKGTLIALGVNFGFAGSTQSTSFTDTNIVPDFVNQPPRHTGLFVPGAIISVEVTNGGSGFEQDTIGVSITTSTGSDAVLAPVVVNGELSAIMVLNPGKGYLDSDAVVISGEGGASGSGATAQVVVYPKQDTFGGSTKSVTVLTQGANYINPTVTAPPSGADQALLTPVVVGGKITEINIVDPGTGYDDALPYSVTISGDSPGPGSAAAELHTNRRVRNLYPGVVGFFQQRKVYAASLDKPETLWFSRTGQFDNFDISNPVKDDDAITATLASRQINEIKYMVGMPGGLITLTSAGAWQVSGGGSGNNAVTPSNITATPQAYNGCADIEPLVINYDILYVQQKGTVVRDLSYNFYVNIYTGVDVSLYSNHLFDSVTLRRWTYAEEPFKLVWAVRSDGKLLSLAFLKEQEIAGWSHHSTLGTFESVASLQEGNENAVYFVIRRFINGKWTQFIERLVRRQFTYGAEDAWCVDCGLQNALGRYNGTLMASASTGTVDFVAENPVFTADDVGKVMRVGGGIAPISEYLGPNILRGTLTRDIQEILQDGTPIEQPASRWSLTKPISTLSGLDHLEGCTVAILGDGNVFAEQVVEDGQITLPVPASKITVGLPYRCRLMTLPLAPDATSQGKRKKLAAVSVRVCESRGLAIGTDFDNLVEYKSRSDESMGQAVELASADHRIVMNPLWSEIGQVAIEQSYPLPATVLAVIPEIVGGDDGR